MPFSEWAWGATHASKMQLEIHQRRALIVAKAKFEESRKCGRLDQQELRVAGVHDTCSCSVSVPHGPQKGLKLYVVMSSPVKSEN